MARGADRFRASGVACAGPQRISHRVEFAEIQTLTQRVVPVEYKATLFGAHQPCAQSRLQQVKPHQRLFASILWHPKAGSRPPLFNLAEAFEHQFVIGPVRPAMERKTCLHGRFLGCWQQQTVLAKIVITKPINAHCLEKARKARSGQKLAGKQVMPLHCR